MDKDKVSALQMGIVMFLVLIGTSLLLMPSITTRLAGNDMWMTPLLAMFAGYFIVWITFRLHAMFPGLRFTTYLGRIIGSVPGKIAGLLFMVFHLHITAATVRDYVEFMSTSFFEKTPMAVLIVTMVFVCGLAVRGGLETIARCAQLFIPAILLLLALDLFLLLPDLEFQYLLPFMEKGAWPVAQGTLIVDGWFCQFMLVAFLYPAIREQDRKIALRTGHWTVAAVAAIMLVVNLFILMVLNGIAAKTNYPVLFATRLIRVADFIEHVESIILIIWVLGAFIKISLYYYVAAVGIADCLGLRHYRTIVYPVGLLVCAMTVWVAPNLQALSGFISTTGTFYILTGYIAFPALLLAIALLRRKSRA